jgi:hypothetical protein
MHVVHDSCSNTSLATSSVKALCALAAAAYKRNHLASTSNRLSGLKVPACDIKSYRYVDKDEMAHRLPLARTAASSTDE